MLLLIDNFDSFTYNIASFFNLLGKEVLVKRNNEISLEEVSNINFDYLVIGPGPGNPQNAGISKKLIEKFAGLVPILGICLGHQAIAEVFEGSVVKSQNPMHGKKEKIFHKQKGIFRNIPLEFYAIRYNSLAVKKPLPVCLEITALNQAKEIMGLKHKTLPIEGIQFHPESIFSEQGKLLLKNFLKN